MRLFRFLCLLPALVLVAGLSARQAEAKVRVNAPVVDYQTFPVGRPPMHADGIEEGEAGLCHTQIACDVAVSGNAPHFALFNAGAALSSVTFVISAKITIYIQEGGTSVIMEHEETHRAIFEHYYALAHAVAGGLADEAIARKLTLTGKPREQALDRALAQVQTDLVDEFMRRVYRRSEFAQKRFDEITDHGRNEITNVAAMAQALEEEAVHWKSQAAEPAKQH